MPMRREEYPDDWEEISLRMRELAGWECEGSPDYPNCDASNGLPHPETGSIVVLTVAHLNHEKMDCKPTNLRVWCQRCHLNYDRHRHVANRKRNRMKALEDAGQLTIKEREDER